MNNSLVKEIKMVNYCPCCGNKIEDNERFCAKCGFSVQTIQEEYSPANNGLSIVGFVLSFFISIAGLIISAIVLHKTPISKRDHAFGKAGLIISIISLVTIILSIIFWIIFYFLILNFAIMY
ncbi:MAG: zinc ribbon domain-containing protein [Acholeplasmatales bacterium]|jgi:uncharacterized membrane protein YvbJ|nr:zinc ribbon domain-containing protein [Acholeplasmatales bacterium]